MQLTSICGVIIAADNPQALAEFYAQAFDVTFEREAHGDLKPHFGVDIGSVHLGIHPPENLHVKAGSHGTISIAYHVESLNVVMANLARLSAEQLAEPHDEGFGPVAAYRDPEGNVFEIVELDYEFGHDEDEEGERGEGSVH